MITGYLGFLELEVVAWFCRRKGMNGLLLNEILELITSSLVTKTRGQWYWETDNQQWIPMETKTNAILEEAFQKKEDKVKIDSERFVNLKSMRQHRIDNPSKQRTVKREGITRSIYLLCCFCCRLFYFVFLLLICRE
jgi:hypothetical protein